MRFLADMGVSQQVVEWLRANGHEAVHLRDEGLQRLPNGEIFQKASREHRIVLTFDSDFGEILAASGGQIVSVILFRLRNTRANFVIQRLDDFPSFNVLAGGPSSLAVALCPLRALSPPCIESLRVYLLRRH